MEYFEICEITPKIQCSNCMSYWPKCIVYCTCGTCLRPSDKVRKLNSDRHDVLSIPNYVIKKGSSHGALHGNTESQRICHAAHVSSKKAEKKGFTPILDRFLKCPINRRSQMDIVFLLLNFIILPKSRARKYNKLCWMYTMMEPAVYVSLLGSATPWL